MAVNETSICNMALGMIGASRINDLTSDTTPEAIQCRTYYEITRDMLLRSYWWNFAFARADLVLDTETPSFEWDYQFLLPFDFLRMKPPVEDDDLELYTIEGKKLLTDDSEVSIRYISKVTDAGMFDPLFVEVLVLQLALKFISALAGTRSIQLRQDLKQDLFVATRKAMAVNSQETNDTGSSDWNNARFGSGKV